jgi:hypothetical protein
VAVEWIAVWRRKPPVAELILADKRPRVGGAAVWRVPPRCDPRGLDAAGLVALTERIRRGDFRTVEQARARAASAARAERRRTNARDADVPQDPDALLRRL